jgi:hypothetical protein
MADSEREAMTPRERFLELLCAHTRALYMISVVCLVLFVISAISFPFLDPGTPSYVLLQIDLALLVAFLAVLAAVVYRCRQFAGR